VSNRAKVIHVVWMAANNIGERNRGCLL